MVTKVLSGGENLHKVLQELSNKVRKAGAVQVGFMPEATYPDGTPVAYIASIQEYGGTAKIPAHTQTIYRQLNNAGDFNKKGQFVKRAVSNYATDHEVKAYTITIPPRPFFRNMIAAKSPEWGKRLGEILKRREFDSATSLGELGEEIKGQLMMSIRDFSDPPNAKSTIAKKGFNDPLIDSGHMLRSVASVVKDESA